MVETLEDKKITKGNIPINKKLLNKYSSAEKIFKYEKYKIKNKIYISRYLLELQKLDLKNCKINDIKILACKIFEFYHNYNYFYNNENCIYVNKSGLNESIEKIYHNRIQRNYLKEHLLIISMLGKL